MVGYAQIDLVNVAVDVVVNVVAAAAAVAVYAKLLLLPLSRMDLLMA